MNAFDLIQTAFHHPEPWKEGDPRCPGCNAEAALAVVRAAIQAAEEVEEAFKSWPLVNPEYAAFRDLRAALAAVRAEQ